MGKINTKYKKRFSVISRTQSIISSYKFKNCHIGFGDHNIKKRSCKKKKVLILGLDGAGKTDLFTRLICHDKQSLKLDSLPHPTIGYNVETIKIYSKQLCQRHCHKITLWDCGGQSSLQPLWSYHFSNTSLLLWLINVNDRSRLDANLELLAQILTNPLLCRVPVLIILYQNSFDRQDPKSSEEDGNEDLLTNLEVAFHFLTTLSSSRANTFKWQVINVNLHENSTHDLKKIRQAFKELMEL